MTHYPEAGSNSVFLRSAVGAVYDRPFLHSCTENARSQTAPTAMPPSNGVTTKFHLIVRVWRENTMWKASQPEPGSRMGWRRIVLCLGILIMSGVTAIGQLTTGTITGTVTDQSGAAVPGATVTLKNTDTGISRTAQTAENGKYEALSLPAGSYEISAALTGFRTVVHTGISLTVGQNAVVDFALQVGQVNESVTVTGEIAQIETTTA